MSTLASPTLSDLRTSVRTLLNQPSSTNSFWSDTELDMYINEAIRIYFAELANVNEGHFAAVADLAAVNGQETVALPSDFFMIRAVYRKTTNGYVMLKYNNNLTEGYTTQTDSGGDAYMPYYYFRGNNLVLRPIPGFSDSTAFRIEYIQFPDVLAAGSDTLTTQITPVFKQCVEMYAVYKAKMKESLVNGVDTSALAKANLAEVVAQYREVIALRSKNPVFTKAFNPERF